MNKSGKTLDWVAHHSRIRPDTIALHGLDDGETRTWAELESRVASLAAGLREDGGLRPGDYVVSLSDGNIRIIELQFACIRAELVLVPLNFRLAVPELADMCRVISPALMVTDSVWGCKASQVAQAVGIPKSIHWAGARSEFEQWARGLGKLKARSDMREDQSALILFTSGSTGAPKAAICTIGNLQWQAFNQVDASRVAEKGAHVFTPLPLFHAGGLNSLTNPVLIFGGKVTISARFDPAVAVDYLGNPANAVTHIALVPLMYELICAQPQFETCNFSSIRTALVAGGRLSNTLRSKWASKGVAFATQYGSTETGPTAISLHPAYVDKASAGSCGTKAMFVDIRLIGDGGTDVAIGNPGEIWLKGPAITPGYLGRSPETDFSDGWYRTGDVARIDEDGFYYIVDRLKDMYKSGGENVSSAEVEAVLSEHPDVKEVAVIGVSHPKWGEVGLAVVVAREGGDPALASLRQHCEGRLARYKFPHVVEVVEALARNATGKIAKDELRRRFRGTTMAQ